MVMFPGWLRTPDSYGVSVSVHHNWYGFSFSNVFGLSSVGLQTKSPSYCPPLLISYVARVSFTISAPIVERNIEEAVIFISFLQVR